MHPARVISNRESRTYFNSPVAYSVVTVFTIVVGFVFFNNLCVEKQADMRSVFSLAPLMFCFFAPAVTMRLLAEEMSKELGHIGRNSWLIAWHPRIAFIFSNQSVKRNEEILVVFDEAWIGLFRNHAAFAHRFHSIGE